MSRKRYISTNLSVDPRVRDLAKRDEFAALLYTWMIPHADDSGCVSADPDTLLMQVVPGFRWRTAQNVAEAVEAMVGLGLVERDGEHLRFPSKSFYKYQTYVGADRRNNGHDPEPSGNGEESRKVAQNSAVRESAPEPAQNPASVSFSSSSSSSVSFSEVTTVSLRSTGSGKKPRAAPGNSRVAAYVDAYRAFCGEHEPPMCPRDAAAIKRSTAPPELIAETYRVIKLGQWGTEFQRNNLCVHSVVGWVNAYALWREERGLEPFERRHDPSLVLVSA